jgi:hypothetical protein
MAGEMFFGKPKTKKFYLTEDKSQYIEHRKLDEGQRRDYEDSTSREMTLKGDEVKLQVLTGSDRKALFNVAVIGYNILVEGDDGKPVNKTEFNTAEWSKLQEQMDSEMAQALLDDIRSFNSWLLPADSDKKK